MAILDFNMDGVKPAGEFSELQEGEYLVRIEGTEKKATKDKFNEDGTPHIDNGKNFYLNIAMKIGSGPDEGRIEMERLNLWNANTLAVNIAKSTLKSIQDAVNVYSNDSDDLHGKFMLLRVKKSVKGILGKHYEKVPAGMEVAVISNAPTLTTLSASANTAIPAPATQKPSWAV